MGNYQASVELNNRKKPFFDEEFLLKLERLAILSRQTISGQMQGERKSSKHGQSVEFADFRPYVSGDDFRRIDWNAYARLERFFIKLFIEEEDLTVHFLLDNSASMDWGNPDKFQFVIRAVGAIGYVVLAGLDRVTINTLGYSTNQNLQSPLKQIRGKNQAIKLFNHLQSIPIQKAFPSGRKLEILLHKYAETAGNACPLLIFSDLMDDGWRPGIKHLAAAGFDITVLHILSPDEIDPNLDGEFRLIDRETNEFLEITADFSLNEQYRKNLSGWQSKWQSFCQSLGIHYLPVVTSIQLEQLLFAHLRQRGVLR